MYREEGNSVVLTMSREDQLCEHGVSGKAIGPDVAELNDPFDDAIMAFYSACDCCGLPMHHSSPYQYIPQDGRTLCFACCDPAFPMRPDNETLEALSPSPDCADNANGKTNL
jgi:hypothetical protein